VEFLHDDMLNFLVKQPACSAAQIISAWAIGYSQPDQIIKQAARVLRAGGVFAFVVNCADTLRPIQLAFRKCMARYPEFLKRIVFPTFPENSTIVKKMLTRRRFKTVWFDEALHPVGAGIVDGSPILPWLLKTGILAGFDRMLPLHEPGPVSAYFEELLQQNKDPFLHHYIAAVAVHP
jgi:SAM-dependent methyltransferase